MSTINDLLGFNVDPKTIMEVEEKLKLQAAAQRVLEPRKALEAQEDEKPVDVGFVDLNEVRQISAVTGLLDNNRDSSSRPKWLEMLDGSASGGNPEFQALREEAQALIQRHKEVPLWFLFELERKPGVRGPRMAFIARNADNRGLANLAWLNCGWRILRRWADTDMDLETANKIDMYLDALAALQDEDSESWGVTVRQNREWKQVSLMSIVEKRSKFDNLKPTSDDEFDLDDDDDGSEFSL